MNLSSVVLTHITRLAFATSSLGEVLSVANALTTACRLHISSAAGIALPDTSPIQRPSLLSLSLKRSEEHTSELQSRLHLVCRLLLEKKKFQYISLKFAAHSMLTATHLQTPRC